MFATCATNLIPLVDNIRPSTNPRYIIDTVKVQSALINDLISFIFRHFSYVSDTLHNRTSFIVQDYITYR